jgi:hypothetical protein
MVGKARLSRLCNFSLFLLFGEKKKKEKKELCILEKLTGAKIEFWNIVFVHT